MESILKLLHSVADLAGIQLAENQIHLVERGCPHQPTGLTRGKMGIYMFYYENSFLKIGKAGPNSNARYQSHPYNPGSSNSNLAKSILNDKDMAKFNLKPETVGLWIRQNVHRHDILLDESLGIFVLNLFEAFLHCRFRPKYEGFETQRN